MSSGELSERGSTAPLRRRPSRWTHMSRRPWSPVAVAREASRRPPPLPKAPRERGPRSCGGERSHMCSYVFLSNIDHMWFFFSGGQGHHRASAIARGRSCCCLQSEWDRKCEKKAGCQRSAAPLRIRHNDFVCIVVGPVVGPAAIFLHVVGQPPQKISPVGLGEFRRKVVGLDLSFRKKSTWIPPPPVGQF